MPTAADAIAAWLTTGDPNLVLWIQDKDIVALPPLPATVRTLVCYNCVEMTNLGLLPVGLLSLRCIGCAFLFRLPRLPATLQCLYCKNCYWLARLPRLPAALVELVCVYSCYLLTRLPPLPAALTKLDCSACSALTFLPPLPAALVELNCWACAKLLHVPPLPAALSFFMCDNVCPAHVRLLDARTGLVWNDLPVEGPSWRQAVAACHATDCRHVAALLPCAASLYVCNAFGRLSILTRRATRRMARAGRSALCLLRADNARAPATRPHSCRIPAAAVSHQSKPRGFCRNAGFPNPLAAIATKCAVLCTRARTNASMQLAKVATRATRHWTDPTNTPTLLADAAKPSVVDSQLCTACPYQLAVVADGAV